MRTSLHTAAVQEVCRSTRAAIVWRREGAGQEAAHLRSQEAGPRS